MNIRSSKILSMALLPAFLLTFFVLPALALDRPVPVETIQDAQEIARNLQYLEKYLEANPDDPEALLRLGILYMRIGRHPEAIPLIEKAMEIKPNSGYPVAWLARAMAETGRVDEARDLLEQAVELDPQNVRLNVLAGGVAYQIGDFVRALEIAREFTGSNLYFESSDGSDMMLEFFATIEVFDLDEAAFVIENVVKQNRQPPLCLEVNLADMYIGHGDFDLAIQTLDEMPAECDPCGTISLRKGYIRDLEGDFEAAADYYLQATDDSCPELPPNTGAAAAGILYANALRKSGDDPDHVIDILETNLEYSGPNPLYFYIATLATYDLEDDASAEENFFRALETLPINFDSYPGYYSIFTESDFSDLSDIAYSLEQNMDYIEIPCDYPDAPAGIFFTAVTIGTDTTAGISNLLRYYGEGDNLDVCAFDVYLENPAIDFQAIDSDPNMFLIPIMMSDQVYFLRNIYPSGNLTNKFWYVPLTSVFSHLLDE